ncbi:MAG TPA: subclass B3 metallo-beta-lactamase [Pyrinomonadaceae bacterium]
MKLTAALVLLLLFSSQAFAQMDETDRRRNAPVEPFRVIDNVYYVGASDVTAFLVTTPRGHILIDAGYAETAPQIKANVARLGFKIEDVKILLTTQAHFDHAGGLAELKRASGARLLASREDAALMANGGKGDFAFGDRFPYEAVKTDKTIADGEKIGLGGVTLKAVSTPGHTKGCTAYTTTVREGGKKYEVVFFGSTTAPGYKLVGNEQYPNLVADYERTFRVSKALKPDVFLASHGSFFDLAGKAERARQGAAPNPFIDPESYRRYIGETEKTFREQLLKETRAK